VHPLLRADLWPQLFSDVSCIALWISSEKILTRLYSVLHWFHKRLEANVKKPRENRCFQTVIVFSFGSFDNSNKCTVLWKIAARLITVSTSVNKEMWVKLSPWGRGSAPSFRRAGSRKLRRVSSRAIGSESSSLRRITQSRPNSFFKSSWLTLSSSSTCPRAFANEARNAGSRSRAYHARSSSSNGVMRTTG